MNHETKILGGIGLITVAVLAGAIFFLTKFSPNQTAQRPVDSNVLGILTKEDSYKRSFPLDQIATSSAKVNIVEFSDFECPACAAAEPVVKQILTDYQGKVSLTYRHFPLPKHKNSLKAAQAAEAAGEQGKFWQMHDLLFEKQDEWTKSSDTSSLFLDYAQSLSLDQEKLKTDMESEKLKSKIKRDLNDVTSLRLNSTPTFFVNGENLEDFSYTTFKSKIDSELSR